MEVRGHFVNLNQQKLPFTFLIRLLICCAWLVSCSKNYSGKTPPKVIDGTMDLSSWDFEKDGPVNLEGDWLFFWNRFLTAKEVTTDWTVLAQNAGLMKVPGFFVDARKSDQTPDSKPMFGFGSYLLKVKGASSSAQLALGRARLHSSARIFIFNLNHPESSLDDIQLGQTGINAANSVPHISTLKPKNLQINPTEDFYVLIQLSNFYFAKGGISPAPTLNEAHAANAVVLEDRTYLGLTVGIAMALAFYNFTLFMRNREDRASLYLSIFCLLLVWRTICSLIFDRPGVFDLEMQYKTFYMTMVIHLPFFGFFLAENFRAHISRPILKVFTYLCGAYTLFVLLTPTVVFSRAVAVGQLLLAVTCLYFFYSVIRAYRARELGAVFSLLGCAGLILCTAADILYAIGFRTGTGMNAHYGLVLFLFMQSQIVGIRFASAFRQADHLSRKLQEEVDRQTRDIKSIFKSIRQGIFSIRASDHKTDDQTSEYLGEMLHTSKLQGQTIQDLLLTRSQLSADSQNQVGAAVSACLGEDVLAFELNEGNLVKELTLVGEHGAKDRILEVDWAPILGKELTTEKLLVCLRDVTDIREFERQAHEKDQDLRMVLEILSLPEDRFQRFMKTTRQFMEENRLLVHHAQASKPDMVKRLFVNMHTIKGGARTYSLKSLSDQSHVVEQNYVNILQGVTAWDKELLLRDLENLHAVIEHYQRLAQEKLGWNLEQRDIRMPKNAVEFTINRLDNIEQDHLNQGDLLALNDARGVLVEHSSIRISSVVEELKSGLQSMARDLEKEMPLVVIEEGDIWLFEQAGNILHSCFVHLLRNSIDHGLETAEERRSLGKNPRGQITLKAVWLGNDLVIRYADDGRGLNLEKIRLLGLQRKLIVESESSPQVLADLILHSGFSTKDEVSEISGRGVGMDAVRTFLEQHEGFIFLELGNLNDTRHVPFTIKIMLPRSLSLEMLGQKKAI